MTGGDIKSSDMLQVLKTPAVREGRTQTNIARRGRRERKKGEKRGEDRQKRGGQDAKVSNLL